MKRKYYEKDEAEKIISDFFKSATPMDICRALNTFEDGIDTQIEKCETLIIRHERFNRLDEVQRLTQIIDEFSNLRIVVQAALGLAMQKDAEVTVGALVDSGFFRGFAKKRKVKS